MLITLRGFIKYYLADFHYRIDLITSTVPGLGPLQANSTFPQNSGRSKSKGAGQLRLDPLNTEFPHIYT